MIYKQKIKVNMNKRGLDDLTKEERDWLDNNIPLLYRRIIEIVEKYKGDKAPCNTRIAKELFPPSGDNGQNFTCEILDKIDGEELISKKDGKSQGSPRRWYLTKKGKTMINKEKAQQGIDSLKEAICNEIENDHRINVPELAERLNLKVLHNKHGMNSDYLTWCVVCMLENDGEIEGEMESGSYRWSPKEK